MERRDANPWLEDTSRKVVGLNPGAGKGFFLMCSVCLHDYPVMEFLYYSSVIFRKLSLSVDAAVHMKLA